MTDDERHDAWKKEDASDRDALLAEVATLKALLKPELILWLRLKLAQTNDCITVNDVDIVPSIKALIAAAEGEAKP